jgi:hypothetical protein
MKIRMIVELDSDIDPVFRGLSLEQIRAKIKEPIPDADVPAGTKIISIEEIRA